MGCNMRIRPQQLVEILHFNTMETCPACQRILVHEDLIKQEEARPATLLAGRPARIGLG